VEVRRTSAGASAKAVRVPPYLRDALRKQPSAKKMFEGFSLSQRREYVEWLTEAKTDETRQRRLETALAWMKEGKPRNWKYLAKKR